MFQMQPSIRADRVNILRIRLCKRHDNGSSNPRWLMGKLSRACGFFNFNSVEKEPRSLLWKYLLSRFF